MRVDFLIKITHLLACPLGWFRHLHIKTGSLCALDVAHYLWMQLQFQRAHAYSSRTSGVCDSATLHCYMVPSS